MASGSGAWGRPVGEVHDRVARAVKTGGLLAGWKFTPYPVAEAEGLGDLPAVRLQGFAVEETTRSQNASFAAVTIAVIVATPKEKGLANLATEAQKVIDAIETDSAGEVDESVSMTTIRGVTIRQNQSGASGNAVFCTLDVACETAPFGRAARHS